MTRLKEELRIMKQATRPLAWISSESPASLVRLASSRLRTVITKTESSASLGALAVLDTSRRKVRSLRTVPAVLFINGGRRSSCSR
jgi:hypothetical protein